MTELDDMVENFELLGDWEVRYRYLMELGEQLPAMPVELKTEENRVKPCMSTVYVTAVPGTGNGVIYLGDCDTPIIKGVLALLIALCNERSCAEIQAIDVDEVFARLQLADHLSPSRHVGIYAIVDLMKQQARELDTGAPARAHG